MSDSRHDPVAAARAAAAAQELFLKGLALHQKGQLAEAEGHYRQALSLRPQFFDALHLIGVIALQRENFREAVELIDKAIAVDPNCLSYVNAYVNRGVALRRMGQAQAATESFDRAIQIKPDHADAYFNRGIAQRDQGHDQDAVASFDAVIKLRPKNADAYHNRGLALSQLRQHQAAIASYDMAIALQPGFADALNNRANALSELKHFEAAVAAYDQAIAAKGANAHTYNNRGHALRALKRYEAAIASYTKALDLNPDYPYLRGLRLHTKMQICAWDKVDADIADIVERVDRGEKAVAVFPLLALTDSSALHRKAAELWVQDRFPPVPEDPDRTGDERHDKIRLGYFSPDFRDHPVAALVAGLFEVHDRTKFEVHGFSYGPDTKDDMRKRLEGAFDTFIDVRAKTDADIAALARRKGIDIAIDLAGHTTDARTGIFARRAAPLQVNYLGYPGTMGASYMDYIIADGTVISEEARAHIAEKIILLPHSYQVNDTKRAVADTAYTRDALGLTIAGFDKAFVFCCFNNSFKITPQVFAGWMRILKEIDAGVLWLLEDSPEASRNLRTEAARLGLDPARLVFAERLPHGEHLARHKAADLFLDTSPYNAHTTASDALWAGLPILTCPGRSFASRVAASLLRAAGLPELIAGTPAAYEALAVALARDPARLGEIRRKLDKSRATAPLFDTARFATHIEAAFSAIVARAHAGMDPADMDVPA